MSPTLTLYILNFVEEELLIHSHFLSFLNFDMVQEVEIVPGWTQGVFSLTVNTLRPRQNGPHFQDDIFKCISLNENVWISIKISLKFVPKGPINNIPALVQIMAWRRPGDKPLSGPVMVRLWRHKCVTRPQWVKTMAANDLAMQRSMASADLVLTRFMRNFLLCAWCL